MAQNGGVSSSVCLSERDSRSNLSALACVELPEDMPNMSLDRGLTDEEAVADGAVREAKSDKFRYLDLSFCELRERTYGSAS